MAFKIRVQLASLIELSVYEWFIREAHKARATIAKFLSTFANPYGKIPIYFRYFYMSSKFRTAFYYFHNGNHVEVIPLLLSIPEEKRNIKEWNMLARSYQRTGNLEESKKIRESVVSINIKNSINEQSSHSSSSFQVLKYGGRHLHMEVNSEEGKITTITKTVSFHLRPSHRSIEAYFYQHISRMNPKLYDYIPAFHNYSPYNRVGQLTIEYVHGRKPQLHDLNQAFTFQRELYKIRHLQLISSKKIKPIYPYITNTRFIMELTKGALFTSRLKSIESRLISYHNIPNVKNDLAMINSAFNNPWIGEFIDLREDLVLQHKDFKAGNMFINENGNLIVLDWETCNLSVPGSDLLYFILSFTLDYTLIQGDLFQFIKDFNFKGYQAITAYLTYLYLEHLANQPEGVRIQENWNLAIEYLKKSPLNH